MLVDGAFSLLAECTLLLQQGINSPKPILLPKCCLPDLSCCLLCDAITARRSSHRMTQEVCWPLQRYRKGQYSSTHNARCHCSQNLTASVASYPALTFFSKRVRYFFRDNTRITSLYRTKYWVFALAESNRNDTHHKEWGYYYIKDFERLLTLH